MRIRSAHQVCASGRCIRSVRQVGASGRCVNSIHQVGASGRRINSLHQVGALGLRMRSVRQVRASTRSCVRSAHQLALGAHTRRTYSGSARPVGASIRAVRVRSVHQVGASTRCIMSAHQVGASGRSLGIGALLASRRMWTPCISDRKVRKRRGETFSRGLGRSFDRAWGKKRSE